MRKLVIVLGLMLLVGALFSGCGGSESDDAETTTTDTQTSDGEITAAKVFTVEELAEFDGEDGNPAFIAVDGVVYDVEGATQWSQGDHIPCNLDAMAGKDLSDELEQAPERMRAYVLALPVVGILEE